MPQNRNVFRLNPTKQPYEHTQSLTDIIGSWGLCPESKSTAIATVASQTDAWLPVGPGLTWSEDLPVHLQQEPPQRTTSGSGSFEHSVAHQERAGHVSEFLIHQGDPAAHSEATAEYERDLSEAIASLNEDYYQNKEQMLGSDVKEGNVKSWNDLKGFGFIEIPDGEDLFVHRTNLVGVDALNPGDEVKFVVGFDEKRKRKRAEKVTGGTGAKGRGKGSFSTTRGAH